MSGLTWKKETPTEEGLYWYRKSTSLAPEVVRVFGENGTERALRECCTLFVVFHGSNKTRSVTGMVGMWAGPLQQPADSPLEIIAEASMGVESQRLHDAAPAEVEVPYEYSVKTPYYALSVQDLYVERIEPNGVLSVLEQLEDDELGKAKVFRWEPTRHGWSVVWWLRGDEFVARHVLKEIK